ncbi:MAG TPA: AI-2E family transporter, partial [Ktedonobacteraceae bacterium]|nr:AI-2E family transporter [Ktedonobacteraceae bacterium]
MEQRDNQEETENLLSGSDPVKSDESTDHEQQNNEAAVPRRRGRSTIQLGQMAARLQAARQALRNPTRNVLTRNESSPSSWNEEIGDELSPVDALTLDVARWIRRVLIPLSILAWAGVAILILMAAGYLTRTLLLLGIAILLAYALSPLVTFFSRVMPRLVAVLVVYLLMFGVIGTLLYFIVRTSVDQIISLSHYVGILLTPGKNGHPSALEQRLHSFGISQAQITSIQSMVISQAEGFAGNIVLILTGVAGAALDII